MQQQWQIQLCFYCLRQTYYLFFFFFEEPFFYNFNVFPTFTRVDFGECFEATLSTSSRLKFMHIAYVNSSLRGEWKKGSTDGRKEGRMWIWCGYGYRYMHICVCVSLTGYCCRFERIICIFAYFNLPASFCFISFFFYYFFLAKNLIVNKNLPCGKFVMQTNEKARSKCECERGRSKGRQRPIWSAASVRTFCCLNNACNAGDFTLTRRYLIELMGKMLNQGACEGVAGRQGSGPDQREVL